MGPRFIGIAQLAIILTALTAVIPLQGFAQSTSIELKVASPFPESLAQLDVDPSESYAVAVAFDGTVTSWDLKDIRLAPAVSGSTLYVPLRRAQQSRAVSVAISPDATLIAVGVPPEQGSTDAAVMSGSGTVYIYERVNRRLIATSGGKFDGLRVPTSVTKLKFSPDGKFLVAALGSGCGVRVWDVAKWSLFASDDAGYTEEASTAKPDCSGSGKETSFEGLQYHSNSGIIFPAKARGSKIWFTVSGTAGIRNYTKTAKGIAILNFRPRASLGLSRPRDLAINSKNTLFAIGDLLQPRVAVLDVESLEPAGPKLLSVPDEYIKPEFRKEGGTFLGNVAWVASQGQEWLVAGGYLSDHRLLSQGREQHLDPKSPERRDFGEYVNNAARWELANPKQPKLFAFGNNAYAGLAALSSGKLLIAAVNAVGTLNVVQGEQDPNRPPRRYLAFNRAIDIRTGSLDTSPDGKRIRIQNYLGSYTPAVFAFDLTTLTLSSFENNDPKAEALRKDAAYEVPDQAPEIVGSAVPFVRLETDLPKFFGKPFAPDGVLFNPAKRNGGEVSRSAALSKDKTEALWGTSSAIRLVKDNGTYAEVICQRKLRYETMMVNLAGAGRLAIAAHSDGTIRWYRINKTASGCSFDLLLTLYIQEAESRKFEWAAVAPSGYFYLTSPKGAGSASRLLGWLGADGGQQPHLFPFGKFYNRYFNPNRVRWALAGISSDFSDTKSDGADKNTAEVSRPGGETSQGVALAVKQADRYQISLADPKPVAVGDNEPLVLRLKLSGPEGPNYWPLYVNAAIGGQTVRKTYNSNEIRGRDGIRIDGPGEYEFKLAVPLDQRSKKDRLPVTVKYRLYSHENDPFQEVTFDNFSWSGSPGGTVARRIFAVIVGLSYYETLPALHYPHEDAIDFAKELMNDFEKINPAGEEFQALHITLLHSHNDQVFAPKALKSLKDQREKLRGLSREISFEDRPIREDADGAIKNAIKHYIADASTPADDGSKYSDSFIFFFAGHGTSEPGPNNNPADAKNYLVMPLAGMPGSDSFESKRINIYDIAKLFERTTAEKLIIIDACRTSEDKADLQTSVELQDSIDRLMAAGNSATHLFISSDLGKESVGLPYDEFKRQYPDLFQDPAHPEDPARPVGSGNGVFTNLLLKSFHCPESDYLFDGRVLPHGIAHFFARYYASRPEGFTALEQALAKAHFPEPPSPAILPHKDARFIGWYRRLAPGEGSCFPPTIAQHDSGAPIFR
jgi:hypothetical protein